MTQKANGAETLVSRNWMQLGSSEQEQATCCTPRLHGEQLQSSIYRIVFSIRLPPMAFVGALHYALLPDLFLLMGNADLGLE